MEWRTEHGSQDTGPLNQRAPGHVATEATQKTTNKRKEAQMGLAKGVAASVGFSHPLLAPSSLALDITVMISVIL